MIKGFRHTCVMIKDLEKSLRFYRDLIGLKLFKIITLEDGYADKIFNKKGLKLTYAKLRSPYQSKNSPPIFELHLWRKPKVTHRPGYNHISFTVKNLDGEYKRLKRSGVRFISKPVVTGDGKRKICFCFDPDNNLIEFIEDLR